MSEGEIKNIVLLGSGNLAWHLGHQFKNSGLNVLQIYSRNSLTGESLAGELGVAFTNSHNDILKNADLHVIAVSDDSIANVLEQMIFSNQFVVHTAGSVSLDVFSEHVLNCGVLYPLQTFTKSKPVNFKRIPFLIEANDEDNLAKLHHLAHKMSSCIYHVNSEKRLKVHLAAVIASNFSNFFFKQAENILQQQDLSFDILEPLLRETLDKALELSPALAQTGPAVRGNKLVIEKHLTLLNDQPEIQELYRMVSESIRREKGDREIGRKEKG